MLAEHGPVGGADPGHGPEDEDSDDSEEQGRGGDPLEVVGGVDDDRPAAPGRSPDDADDEEHRTACDHPAGCPDAERHGRRPDDGGGEHGEVRAR